MAQWNMKESEWENHPEGVYVGRLASFEYEGEVETQYGVRERGYYEVQTEEVDSVGTLFPPLRLYVYPSSSEKSRIVQLRNAVAGRKLRADERTGNFDTDTLLNHQIQIQVVHNPSRDGEKVYANIETMMPLPRPAAPPAGATQTEAQQQQQRWNTQGNQQQREPTAQEAHPPADNSDDLPF